MFKFFRPFFILGIILGLAIGFGPKAFADKKEQTDKKEKVEKVDTKTPAVVAGISAVYVSGNASFPPKTKLMISHSADSYTFTPQKGEAWEVPNTSIRGTIVYDKGVWFYWFDASHNTLNCNLQMSQADAAIFVDEINAALKAANVDPTLQQQEQSKQTFEQYKEKALQESK